jgi:hypothetical protein
MEIMKMSKNKTATLFALFLMFAMASSLVALPAVEGAVTIMDVKTYAYIYAQPNPAGVGQKVLVHVWVEPLLPTADDVFHGYMITITNPDGTNETQGPLTSFKDATAYISYTPDTTGNYTFTLYYPGETFSTTGQYYEPSTSPAIILTVQQQSQQPLPDVPLPTQYWTSPINGQNRLWGSISGDWLMLGYNSSSMNFDFPSGFNPYSQAPMSSHVMWTKPIRLGGIVGGDFGDESYYSGESYEPLLTPPIIMNGRLYYNLFPSEASSGWGAWQWPGFACVDLRTGQELWTNPNYTVEWGQEYAYDSGNQHGIIPYLWGINVKGNVYNVFDPLTGNLLLSFANAMAPSAGQIVYGSDGTVYVYILNGVAGWFAMWNSTKAFEAAGAIIYSSPGLGEWRPLSGTYDWRKGIEWNVTIPDYRITVPNVVGVTLTNQTIGPAQACALTGNVLIASVGTYSRTYYEMGYSLTDGSMLWVNNATSQETFNTAFRIAGGGMYFDYNMATRRFAGYDATNGKQLWVSDQMNYPWGTYTSERGGVVAYGMLYYGGYDGYLHAFNITTGKQVWEGYSGDSGLETPYGTYPMYYGPMIANGVVYMGTGEHSPNMPYYRGEKLFAFDAYTGQQLWNITGFMHMVAIADGYLVVQNNLDNQIYVFGMGPTKTTVNAPSVGVTTDTPVTISGTVTDISAGSQQEAVAANFPNGLPCVSDASMTPWMEFVYEQQPCPANVTGVPVTLSVLDSNGNQYNIGTTTTNAMGMYGLTWTPPIPGNFTVYASFAGSESYYPSSASTILYASAAPAATPPPTPPPASLADIYFLPMSIVILIAVIVATIVIVLVLRKR